MIGAFTFLCVVASYELQAKVTPVQKVLTMMNDMHAKGVTEKQDEEVAFTSFKGWCDHTTESRQKSIKEANELMEQLEADIASAESDVVTLTDEIQDVDNQISQWKSEMQAATEIRDKEKGDYQATHTDLSESIDAVGRAVVTMSKNSGDVSQSLLQVASTKLVPAHARKVVEAFLETSSKQDPLSVSAPQANAYEFQSSGLVKMLTDLEDKFSDERKTLEKEEMTAKQSYEMMMQDLTDEVERAEKLRGRKMKTKGQRQEDSATAKGELASTTASRDEDQKYLDDLVSGCTMKSADFESRQKLRGEELVAIEKAIEIIGSGAVSGAADKHLPAMVQSFSLLRADSKSPLQGKCAAFLQEKASKLQSKMLMLLATKVSEDPFLKVKKMIKDMIVRLMEEANEETEHKGFCDAELGANKVARESKTEDVNSLSAQADQLNADINKLTQEAADLTSDIAELDAAVKEATENRNAEHEKNVATIADAQAATEAVKSALIVLKEFYAKAAEATALLQGQGAMDDAPETFDSSFKGQQASSGGVVGMLEVIESDFARLESDTSSAEDQAASEFKTFDNDSEVDRASKATGLDMTNKLRTRKEGDLATTNKDLKGSQTELDAALAYYDKLKPTCVDSGVNYEDRVERREAEIQSLKEALSILAGEDI